MILVDITPLQSEHRFRGVGHYLYSLLREGAFNHVSIHYIASTFGPQYALQVSRDQLMRLPRPHKPAQVYWLYNELILKRAIYKLRPQVFFAPDFNGLVTNPFGTTVAVLHDLTALKLEPVSQKQSLSERLSNLRWKAYYYKLKRTKHLITISETVKKDAVELLNLDPEQITVIYHGVDHEQFRPSNGVGKYANSTPYFVHIGARNTNKNQARLLEAFRKLAQSEDNVNLYFAGPWSQSDHAWLEQRKMGLSDRVQHLGFVPAEDLPSLYGNAVAFAFPSLEEGFGMPILEAMACGAPVITSNCGAVAEVGASAALLVDPLSVADLTQAMEQLLSNKNLRDTLKTKGFEHAAQFTWEKTAEKTLALLKRVEGTCT